MLYEGIRSSLRVIILIVFCLLRGIQEDLPLILDTQMKIMYFEPTRLH